MYRIDNPSAVTVMPTPPAAGTPGYFTNGNPATAQEATIVDDWWANSLQEEILTVIEQAGLIPAKNKTDQLFTALNLLYAGAGDIGSTYLTVAKYAEWERVKLTSNTASAYTITYTVPPTALADGMVHRIELHIANGARATLNTNGLGAKPIHYYSAGAWRVLPPGLLGANEEHEVSYHAASGAYRLVGWKDRTGDLIPTGRAAARSGTILALGQAVSRTDYAGLFAAFGETFGAGNGSSTFNLPDLRGRLITGTDGGTGRITPAMGGALGNVGGQSMQQFALNGSAPSQTVSGTASITGTASTNGKDVHSTGTTSGTINQTWGGTGGIQVSSYPHNHDIDIHGTITGDVPIAGTGPITGNTAGGLITGTTDNKSNMPPTLVANHAICL
jgi:microcystin-dependent protein